MKAPTVIGALVALVLQSCSQLQVAAQHVDAAAAPPRLDFAAQEMLHADYCEAYRPGSLSVTPALLILQGEDLFPQRTQSAPVAF